MYAVVGCDRCSSLWVVEGRPETTRCPRCRKRHRYETRKKFVVTDDAEHAREARANMLAERGTAGDEDIDLDFAAMGREADEPGMSDEEYLEESGIDADAVADAGSATGNRATGAGSRTGSRTDTGSGSRTDTGLGSGSGSGSGGGSSRSRRAVVLDALGALDGPTEADVVDYAEAEGVGADYVHRALAKLVERGDVTETGGQYRRL